ncbi:hypothetical protein CsSME_00021199 [Camellia sinensis var. sinensis]
MASLLSFFNTSTSILLPKPTLSLTKACAAAGGGGATTLSLAEERIKFSGPLSGEEVELTVRNGSSLRLRIPDGHVTSYKPNVYWKPDGFEEVLYTTPGQEAEAEAKGGIGLVINDVSESEANSKPVITSQWTLKDVDSDSIDALQVELSCKSGNLDISYVVSLYLVSMATAVIVKNNGRKPVKLTGAILNHFKFKKRDGTSIKGLRSCSYCTHPPLPSPFQVLSPSEAMKYEENMPVWSVQDVPIAVLKNKLSRVYAAPPEERRKHFYNTGRELLFRIIKIGFEDIYVSSPGSLSRKFGNEGYFICTGSASMLVPVLVNPGEEWRAAQVIEHDNL